MDTSPLYFPSKPDAFGAWLRQQRRILDMTQAQLAERAGCARITIRKLEAEELRPSRQLALILADALNIPTASRDAFVRFARGYEPGEEWKHSGPSAPMLPPRNNLPLQLTSFVGRQEEIEVLRRLLANSRLLTLTGPGGIGKTRLALRVATEMLYQQKDGAWWVDLSPLTDSSLVPQQVASVLGVRESRERSHADALVTHLSDRAALLVLDNCEHVVTAVGRLAALLLQRGAHLRILATSRESMRIAGEKTWKVPSLSVPTSGQFERLETQGENWLNDLRQYESISLFVERASLVLPTFSLSEENAPAIVKICRRLDGIPLAIELAAARVKVLAPQQIAERLDDAFRLLTAGSRTSVPHHQTLRSTMDWSYQLLSEKEQLLFSRLSVFAGGFSLEAAENVCADEALPHDEILDLLSSLQDKSLVEVEQLEQQTRNHLLETVRQYAGEKLAERGETERLRLRHLDFFVRLAEETEPRLKTAEQARGLARLDVELDNLRGALDWSLKSGNDEREEVVESGLRLAGALWQFWLARGRSSEGRGWMASALERSSGNRLARSRARALVLTMASVLADFYGDLRPGIPWCEEALSIARSLGDQRIEASALTLLGDFQARYEHNWTESLERLTQAQNLARELGDKWLSSLTLELLGIGARSRGDSRHAKSLFEESLALSREVGDPWLISVILDNLGSEEALEGNYERAASLYEEGLALRRQLQDTGGVAGFLNDMGQMARYRQDYARAIQYFEESLALFKRDGQRESTGIVLRNLGWLAQEQGDADQAMELFRESISVFQEIENGQGIIYCLAGIAAATCAKGQNRDAIKLFAAVEVLTQSTGVALPRGDRAEYAKRLAGAKAALPPSAFAAAEAEGQALDLAQAVAFALAGAEQTR